jgi:uracil-DNA glycosylase family 4
MSILDELKDEIAKCELCPELVKNRTQTVFGDGTSEAEVMFIGEAPGKDEDREGIPFVGQAGKLMDNAMEKAGIPRSKIFIANTLKCRPPDNRDPGPEELENCSAYLAAQITLIKPKIIAPLGRFGLERMVKKGMKISEVHGKPIRRKDGLIFFPMFHPAAALHQPRYREDILTDFKKLAKLLKREGLL